MHQPSSPSPALKFPVHTTKIFDEVADGVMFTVAVLDAVTKDVDVVDLADVSVAVTTCKTFPPPASAKVLSPLKKVVES